MEATGVPEHLQTMESVNDLKTKIHELEEKNASALAAVERELKTRMEAISGDVVEELARPRGAVEQAATAHIDRVRAVREDELDALGLAGCRSVRA